MSVTRRDFLGTAAAAGSAALLGGSLPGAEITPAGAKQAEFSVTEKSWPLFRGDSLAQGSAGAFLGLLVHFAIMAVMVAVYVLAATRIPALNRYWWIVGPVYGVVLWIVMYWLVMPLRWESYQTPSEALPILKQLISHCLLTGLPIAWITARSQRAIRPSYI